MAASIASNGTAERRGDLAGPARVLCLGNELIADDGVGPVTARALGERLALAAVADPVEVVADPAVTVYAYELPGVGRVELVDTALTGMYLLDVVVGASRLIIVDSVVTGKADAGTVLVLREQDLDGPRGTSPHYIGILETLELARALRLDVPDDVVILAVEAGDYWTVGGSMTDGVGASVPMVVERAMAMIEDGVAGAAASTAVTSRG
jgi:hydrogenase maturation protease